MMNLFVLTLAFVFSMLVERGFQNANPEPCRYGHDVYQDNGESFKLPGKNPCIDYNCSEGLIHVQSGKCVDNRGNCWAKGDIWEDDCVFYICERISDEIYNPQRLYKGCLDNNGECQDVGFRWVDNRCTRYLCQLGSIETTSHIVSEGCYDRDRCRKVNSTWTINCRNYECIKGRNKLRVRRTSGKCSDANGVCRSNGELFNYHGNTCKCYVQRRRNYATLISCL